MDTTRAEAVAAALVALEYSGLVQFDRHSPAYAALDRLTDEFEREPVALLALCAGTLEARSAAPDRRFWAALERCALDHGEPADAVEAAEILERFVDEPVNAALPTESREELLALFESGFAGWFVDEHLEAGPRAVWNRLADALDAERHTPPVLRAMEAYDLATLCVESEYLPLSNDVPPSSGEPVARVTMTAGLLDADPDEEAVREAWRAIAGFVGAQFGRRVSVLRLGSIVRRLGEVVVAAEPGTERETLATHLRETVGLPDEQADRLAAELTHACRA